VNNKTSAQIDQAKAGNHLVILSDIFQTGCQDVQDAQDREKPRFLQKMTEATKSPRRMARMLALLVHGRREYLRQSGRLGKDRQ
jgi:hypothetical protein